jgi:outer membrane protein OmpA-like peptidoglycan-associated protein
VLEKRRKDTGEIMTGFRFGPTARAVAALALMAVAGCAEKAPQTLTPPKSFVIFFRSDSAGLTSEALVVLDRVAEEARRIKATAVGVTGYTAPSGSPPASLKLSEDRATEVENALLSRGIARDIIVRNYQGAANDVTGPPIEGQRVEIVVSREKR